MVEATVTALNAAVRSIVFVLILLVCFTVCKRNISKRPLNVNTFLIFFERFFKGHFPLSMPSFQAGFQGVFMSAGQTPRAATLTNRPPALMWGMGIASARKSFGPRHC